MTMGMLALEKRKKKTCVKEGHMVGKKKQRTTIQKLDLCSGHHHSCRKIQKQQSTCENEEH